MAFETSSFAYIGKVVTSSIKSRQKSTFCYVIDLSLIIGVEHSTSRAKFKEDATSALTVVIIMVL